MKNSGLKWILMLILRMLDVKSIISLVIKLLIEITKKHESDIDDGCVRIVAELLCACSKEDCQTKLLNLDNEFE